MTTLDIQRQLKKVGFDPGPLDGLPGRQTLAAIKAFQRSKNLLEDGIAGPATMAALFTGTPTETVVRENMPWLDLARQKRGCVRGEITRS
jgi:peptidoglycan hydrolase-like protein with peptidoglycan-binding domain